MGPRSLTTLGSHTANIQALSLASEQVIWGVFQVRNELRGLGPARQDK